MSSIAVAGTADELLALLNKRAAIVRCIHEGVVEKRVMVDEAGASRSTVNRAIRELEAAGIVETRGSDFELTLYGRLVYGEYTRFWSVQMDLLSARDLIDIYPARAPIDLAVLRGADVTVPNPRTPLVPHDKVRCSLYNVETITTIIPVATPLYDELFQRAIETKLTVKCMMDEELIGILSENRTEIFDTALDSTECQIWEVNTMPAFGLLLVDGEHVSVLAYDDNGTLRGTIQNDSPEAAQWAETILYRHGKGLKSSEL